MNFLLALDCSTSRGSVALADASGPVRWRMEIPAGRGHGGQLFGALEHALGEVRSGRGRLERIVVGLGPGSYSGVRQSVAAAVGLAAATGAALEGAPSAAALPVPDRAGTYRAVSDARRGAFYHTVVRGGVCLRGPELLPDAEALDALADGPVFVVESSLPDRLLPDAPVLFPDASLLISLPEETYRFPPLEPIYLRPVSITLPKTAP